MRQACAKPLRVCYILAVALYVLSPKGHGPPGRAGRECTVVVKMCGGEDRLDPEKATDAWGKNLVATGKIVARLMYDDN